MKFFAAIILDLVRGSLYTDENLYHEDKANEAIRRIYAETTQHQVYGYDIPPDKLSINELDALNHDWLEQEVLNDDVRKKFMTWVIDLPHTLSITPESLLYIDQTWDQNQCWVMLVYSSEGYEKKTIEEKHALKSLFVGFNEVFFERCGVATVDLSYPSNRLTFGNLVKNEVPSALFKYPYTFQQMLFDRVTDSDHRFHFLNELKLWGVQKTKQDLENDAIVAALDLVEKYNSLTKPARKIESIYQVHYKDKQSSYVQFQKYSQDIRAIIAERLFTDADKEGLLDCHNESKKCTDEEKENEFKIVKGFLGKQLRAIWENLSLSEELEKLLNHKYPNGKDGKFGLDLFRVKPRPLPDLEKVFRHWMEKFPPVHQDL